MRKLISSSETVFPYVASIFHGRGLDSHAYKHSLDADHRVYINLGTEKIYCLPENYEINDPSLDDIRHVLNPRFSLDQVLQLDDRNMLDGSDYRRGIMGLNNLKGTDLVNVVIQSLMRVTPLRNFFLIHENYKDCKSLLVQSFGELTRKIWRNARKFKGQVSPREFMQVVTDASNNRFCIGVQSDPADFMSWFLKTLHTELISCSKAKTTSSIIHECFQGEMAVVKDTHDRDGVKANNMVNAETSRMPFLMLGLDLPPLLLSKDAIPQVSLFNILQKIDGMRYRVTRLPKYLILHLRRFTKNDFFVEKNTTLVNFPVKNLHLKDHMMLPTPKEEERLCSKYDLVANVVHDGKPDDGTYKAFVRRKSEESWYLMQDLHVAETQPQMVALSETYLQIYEQQ
ncbi:U4/U6.U5 tri-snRNP-associated protein 2 [Artemisia annua]|uniref:U4/U6.U5 tri-snRNP-associated protein 2 n=1 Tax=Artemisia annua TaxID=35608 RepID=A0A2U1N9Q1_ARTAN|nr:U4/U6.U5 tri-snRNP-associated protein 2 [Artemisia annua]